MLTKNIEDFEYNSDEEINEKEHQELIDAVSKLDKSQHIKKPTRTEPTLQISEFNLVKPRTGHKSSVFLQDLVKSLNQKSSHTDVVKKINKVRRKVKTLPKPLEKPQAQRIKRSVGFESVKKSLHRWESIVCANRAAEQIRFPISTGIRVKTEPTERFKSRFRIKSDLELELEQLNDNQVEEDEQDKEEFPLTLKEILERRREAAKLRAQQSYREAKARRQNKIKSKKYHRIQRREKIKQQIKEFEHLQKTNPEEALKKLDEIEKARAEERMSLRHRSTGQWARNKQVRAKYDKESRQVLSQQLAVSRDLTQKLNSNVESSDESDTEHKQVRPKNADAGNNPWTNNTNAITQSKEITDFVSGYRKYWDEKNKSEVLKQEFNSKLLKNKEKNVEDNSENKNANEDTTENLVEINSENYSSNVETKLASDDNDAESEAISAFKSKISKLKEKIPSKLKKIASKSNKISKKDTLNKSIKLNSKQKCQSNSVGSTTDGWLVEEVKTVDEIFYGLEYKMQNKLINKANKLKRLELKTKRQKKVKIQKEKYIPDLSVKSQRQLRPEIDEELGPDEINENTKNLNEVGNLSITVPDNESITVPDIDPGSFIQIKPKRLQSSTNEYNFVSDALDDDEEDDNLEKSEDQHNLISEAFEDDDIVDDFQKDKQAEIDENKPKDVDLSLPGWGSWGGKNISNKRKRKRFIIKMPEKVKRRDDNRGELIIKEFKDKKIKKHQVSEVPFPFESVKDFEASIRAPISNTFIPEIAHRRLTKPAVVTKIGSIIEPMDEDQLVISHIRKLKKGKTKNVSK